MSSHRSALKKSKRSKNTSDSFVFPTWSYRDPNEERSSRAPRQQEIHLGQERFDSENFEDGMPSLNETAVMNERVASKPTTCRRRHGTPYHHRCQNDNPFDLDLTGVFRSACQRQQHSRGGRYPQGFGSQHPQQRNQHAFPHPQTQPHNYQLQQEQYFNQMINDLSIPNDFMMETKFGHFPTTPGQLNNQGDCCNDAATNTTPDVPKTPYMSDMEPEAWNRDLEPDRLSRQSDFPGAMPPGPSMHRHQDGFNWGEDPMDMMRPTWRHPGTGGHGDSGRRHGDPDEQLFIQDDFMKNMYRGAPSGDDFGGLRGGYHQNSYMQPDRWQRWGHHGM